MAPGAFYINDIQQAGLSGDYDVTITEADGSERQFVVPYSSLPVMLRPGGWKYELASGRYDGNLTTDSRRSDFVLGTAVYGLHNNVTLYGGTLLAKDYQSLSLGSGFSLGNFGALSTDVTHSSAKFSGAAQQGSDRQTGQSYRIRYSKSLMSTGTSVDLTALRYSTEHFYSFSEFNSQGYREAGGVYSGTNSAEIVTKYNQQHYIRWMMNSGDNLIALESLSMKSELEGEDLVDAMARALKGFHSESMDPAKQFVLAWGNMVGIPLNIIMENKPLDAKTAAEIVTSGIPTSETKLVQYLIAKIYISYMKNGIRTIKIQESLDLERIKRLAYDPHKKR
ncbi:outer membrane usher protein [Acinetobacter baumannii]|nr:hypothetical protein APT95_01065 [Providencia stuartii]SST01156.1 outer membrane usher protein [Acinetobacter baumannii]